MRIRPVLVVAALAAGLGLSTPASAGPVFVMFTDPAGDTGANNTAVPVPGPAQAGLDLVKGTVQRNKADLIFAMTMASMPAQGSLPEAARLLYHFDVDGVQWRITVKSVDIGKPDALAQSGTERIGKVDQQGHFRLEQCAVDTTVPVLSLSQCKPVAYLKGTVDPVKATLSWTIPLATLKAKTGSKLTAGTGGASNTCEICWVLHYAERSLTPYTVIDSANVSFAVYKLPKS